MGGIIKQFATLRGKIKCRKDKAIWMMKRNEWPTYITMKTTFQIICILLTAGVANAALSTKISHLVPENGALVQSSDGSVTFSAKVVETIHSVKFVKMDLRINGIKQYHPMRYMSQIANSDYYEFVGSGFKSGIEYCFRIRGRNTHYSNNWSEYNCFTVGK